jgi:hypothetical protein
MPEGTVNHQAPRPMIEALGVTRLKINFLIVTIYAGYPQPDCDENGPPKRAVVSIFCLIFNREYPTTLAIETPWPSWRPSFASML